MIKNKIVVPKVTCNQPSGVHNRPDKLIFSPPDFDCGGHKQCAGRRLLEHYCRALKSTAGAGVMDPNCVITMIKIQIEALNQFLDMENSRKKQSLRVEDAEKIINHIKIENKRYLSKGEAEISKEEAFHFISDLLLEILYANKDVSRHFFGIMADVVETKSFKDLDPKIINKFKAVLAKSYHKLVRISK
jgi:hypothetical protein